MKTALPPLSVEIWSDVQCPFCYIGKRQFETALAGLDPQDRDRVEVTWRSYQLDPGLQAVGGESIYEYLARRKGMSTAQSKQMHDQVAQSARSVGLDYQFDKLVVANSHAAHRLIQAAKTVGRGGEAEEAFFQAYFTEGKNLEDRATLLALAGALGLDEALAVEALDDPDGTWKRRVDDEAAEAQSLGTTGVPFFVFQRQFAVTGAQGAALFRKALEKGLASPVE